MREEPVLYINGNPYVVREANKPFANLEYTGLKTSFWAAPPIAESSLHTFMTHIFVLTGINKGHVEAMESRLKQDVLREASSYGNQILVAHEDDDFQVIQKWEPVTEVDVETPLDVYRELEGSPCSLRVSFSILVQASGLKPSCNIHSFI